MKASRKKIVVLMGGWSHEHAVSLKSGAAAYANLSAERYERRAARLLPGRRMMLLPPETAPANGVWESAAVSGTLDGFNELLEWGVDAAVLALHGAMGEDGVVQGFLETLEIAYTHSGVCSSAMALDKVVTKQVYAAAGIPSPRWRIVAAGDDLGAVCDAHGLGWPVVVKSPCLGSSFGLFIVKDARTLEEKIGELMAIDDRVLLEQFIPGREFTCAVVQRGPAAEPEPLPVTEIVPVASEYFDYVAKYTAGASREITPAEISAELAGAIQRAAVRCHQALRCGGATRTDFRVNGSNELFVLETNTIPGMTETSLLPQAAAAAGITFSQLLDLLVDDALARAADQRIRRQHVAERALGSHT